jgi:hypothetical protein
MQASGDPRRAPRRERSQKVQPGAEAQLGNVKAVPEPRRQIVTRQKHVPRFGQPVIEAEIGIVEPRRDGHIAVTPDEICDMVLHAVIL